MVVGEGAGTSGVAGRAPATCGGSSPCLSWGLVLAVTSIHVVGEPQCRAGVALPVVCVAGVAAPVVYIRLMAVPESREQRGPLRAESQLVHKRAVPFVSLAVVETTRHLRYLLVIEDANLTERRHHQSRSASAASRRCTTATSAWAPVRRAGDQR